MSEVTARGSLAGADWADPGYFTRQSAARNVLRVLIQLIKNQKGHKTMPTTAGLILILLSLCLGSAAYNTANNILFLSLALLLSSLLLSGLLSWINFVGTRWRLDVGPHFRAGEVARVRLELVNNKKKLPTYSLWFTVQAQVAGETRRLPLEGRLDPRQTAQLDWLYEPKKRGVERLEISGLESSFPFGFLRKSIGHSHLREVPVWPRRIEYEFRIKTGRHTEPRGDAMLKQGSGSELINLRKYVTGDPMRHVHWKASARMRQMMVRELAEENQDAFVLLVESPADQWPDREQFETMCSFAASLAEDLFLTDRLLGFALNHGEVTPVKRADDLNHFLDQLARLEPVSHYTPADPAAAGASVITLRPGAGKHVYAYVGSNQTGSA